MRLISSPLTLAAATLLGVAPVAIRAQGARVAGSLTIKAENSLPFTRTDETIGVAWSTVRTQIPGADATNLHVVDVGAGREVVAQAVDNDGDGQLDELIFQSTFAPGESRTFSVAIGGPGLKPVPRVYARHIEDRDDIAWESDRIAYRIYGQGLWKVDSLDSNGIDVWVKRTRDLIVDKWYAKGHDLYHRDVGEGADFFDVGQTLGAGGTGVWRNERLFRAHNFKSWRVIANGPVRAIFELQYQPFDSGGLRLTETKRVAIDAGQNINRSVSIFKSESGADIPFAIGLVKRKGMIGAQTKAQAWAWLSGWGPMSPKDGGHGDLGTAVLVERSRLTDWKETDDHYLAIGRAKSGEPVVNWFGAGWTDSGDYRDVRDWWTYLTQFAQRLETPLRVTVR